LSSFGVCEKSTIFVKKVEEEQKIDDKDSGTISEEEFKKQAQMRVQSRFYDRLGLGMIKEEEDGDEEANNGSGVGNGTFRKWTREGAEGDPGARSPDERSFKQSALKKSMSDVPVDTIIDEVKNGNMEKISVLLELSKKDREDVRDLLNTSSKGGWTPLHYAIYYGKTVILKDFIEKGANVNAKTDEGWTPLILAIHLKNVETVKLLLKTPTIDLNQVTSQGSAVHVAAKAGIPEIITMLVRAGCDTLIKDTEGRTVFDLELEEDIQGLLLKTSNGKQSIEEEEKNPSILQQSPQANGAAKVDGKGASTRPMKPPILKGLVFKTGDLKITLNKRYLVVNPDEGTLVRYKSPQEYPLKPM
jgi:hypothetical protein